MQLHALFFRRVLPQTLLPHHDAGGLEHILVFIAVNCHLTLNLQPHSVFDPVQNGFGVGLLHKLVDTHRACKVRDVKAHHPGVALLSSRWLTAKTCPSTVTVDMSRLKSRSGTGSPLTGLP